MDGVRHIRCVEREEDVFLLRGSVAWGAFGSSEEVGGGGGGRG